MIVYALVLPILNVRHVTRVRWVMEASDSVMVDGSPQLKFTKAVIAAAGLGTRLLPATKEQPKEMLPIFALTADGTLCVKPTVQLVFEQLYDVGCREFCFIIGRGKRAIEDHFTQDDSYLIDLERKGKGSYAADLRSFYERLDDSTIVWINQPSPLGFGDAVKKTKASIGREEFLVHAGDTYIMSGRNEHYQRLQDVFEKFDASAVLLLKRTQDTRDRGVVVGEIVGEGTYRVRRAVEKPEKFISDLTIEPVYVFKPAIFDVLEKTHEGKGRELQLTDAVQKLIDEGGSVCAVELKDEDLRLDVGNPISYWEALQCSNRYVVNRARSRQLLERDGRQGRLPV